MKRTSLMLTGYNSELSDSPFRLNRSLAALGYWNEDEIKKVDRLKGDDL